MSGYGHVRRAIAVDSEPIDCTFISHLNAIIIVNFSPFEEKIIEHILKSHAPEKHAARSALRHLERAWKLADDMPELAIFSAITAEEESATALFHVLKRIQYKGAELLNIRDHLHKTALHPFLLAVGKYFAEFLNCNTPMLEFNIDLSRDNRELLRISFTVPDGPSKEKWAYPFPPLDFKTSVNDVMHKFEEQLSQLATEKNASNAFAHVRRLANRRNEILYASTKGIPHAEGVEQFLIYRRSVVFTNLIAILLIAPYPQQQAFVQQALNAFLSMLKLMPDDYETQ